MAKRRPAGSKPQPRVEAAKRTRRAWGKAAPRKAPAAPVKRRKRNPEPPAATAATVERYRFRGIRWATRVRFADGKTVSFIDLMPKNRAIEQALSQRKKGYTDQTQRRNPEQTAAELSERFHGRPAKRITDLETTHREYAELTDLGKLVALVVQLYSGPRVQLDFKGVRLCSSPDGGQLFFEDGDQALDLEALKLDKYLPKAYLDVGLVEKVVYATKRPAYGYAEWHHEFAEDGGELPTLGYDVLNQEIKLLGGSYQTGEWIEN